jgi:hypothetical protein
MTDEEVQRWLSEEERGFFEREREHPRPLASGAMYGAAKRNADVREAMLAALRSLAETRKVLAPLPDILDQRYITYNVSDENNASIEAAVAFVKKMPRPKEQP